MEDNETVKVEDSERWHEELHKYVSSAWKEMKRWATATVILLFILLTAAAFIFWLDLSDNFGIPSNNKTLSPSTIPFPPNIPKTPITPKNSTVQYPLNCSINKTSIRNCTINYPQKFEPNENSPIQTCPDYFRWIYEDLKPWNATGISRETLESGKKLAHFRLAIVDGVAYMEKYQSGFQTRDLFTIWSFVQLLRKYPGKLPDLELMFRVGDIPIVRKGEFQGADAKKKKPPPVLFEYCGHEDTVGIIFPDWSYWGWVETSIKAWELISEEIKEGSKKKKWEDRIPYAYWKGNQYTSSNRAHLMKCIPPPHHDWKARLYQQDWGKEIQQGFKHSNLADQCIYRYKIYVEGRAWSVSDKYILACDSMTLVMKPEYYDFFFRSLVPLQHYWPISPNHLCQNIKFAVDWGNKNPAKAKAIGKSGSDFVRENLKMENVYAYMFHLLNQYSKLLTFKPKIPEGAVKLCAESVACFQNDLRKSFMVDSLVMSPSDTHPCAMPPPYEPTYLQSLFDRKVEITKQVENWVHGDG